MYKRQINKYGKRVSKSRFVEDIKAPTKKEMDSLTIGDKIYHKKFKEGTIVEKNGDSCLLYTSIYL